MFVQFDDESQAVLVHIWKRQTGMGYLTKLCNLTQRNPLVPRRLWWPNCDSINVGFDLKEMLFLPYKQPVVAVQPFGRLPDMI